MNAVITGASRGLGLALVARYAARPESHIFAVAREPDESDELGELVRGSDGRVVAIKADVSEAAAGEAIAAAVGSTVIDLLINNAGASGGRIGFGELTQDGLIELFKVNTFAPLLVTQALRSKLAEHAKVVNITSVLGSIEQAGSGYFAYGMSKAALNMVSKKLAAELPGISVLSLHPGWVRTRMGGASAAIDVATSVDGMVEVIDALGPARSGTYLAYDGSTIPW
ncbi:MAG: SDR family oxidoreductase [Candidatus Eremiobacteraeota bacterium]|nr:SDR family oxidoreductase [Candidatus Eremiobacteraeota bacterium]